MRFSALASLILAGLAASASAESLTPTAKATAMPVPASPSASASLSPSAAASLSPSATETITLTAPDPEMQDDEVTGTAAVLDFGKAETKLLASICEATTNDDNQLLYNLAENQRSDKAGPDVALVDVVGLYNELAKRSLADQADARQALTLAILRGDSRAKDAKDLAYEDKLASSLVKRIKNGDKGAQAQLESLAAKGNEVAKAYFSMGKPVLVGIPEAMSGTASAMTPTAAAQPLSPSAK